MSVVLPKSPKRICSATLGLSTAAILLALAGLATTSSAQALPPVPVPVENPWTAEKAILGKILFWDQQLSTDQTKACGSCHAVAAGGAEAAPGLHPGADAVFATADDIGGSEGVRRRNSSLQLVDDPIFGFLPQVTGRAAPNYFGGLWASNLLLDGRALDEFRDPLTDEVVIASGGALESQSLIPILNAVEMAVEGRTWADVVARLDGVYPLQLATDLPPEITAALAIMPVYRMLFADAFGDPAITPVRIAFAIASYERTLIADQTPWDDFMAGNTSALTQLEIDGWNVFSAVGCADCHVPPLFTDNSFRTIGVRDPAEDNGREAITGDPADRGAFKVPTLRNSALKTTVFHTGEDASILDAVFFYRPGGQPSIENLDPLLPISLQFQDRTAVTAFIEGALVDPRVALELPPFNHPTLGPIPVPEPGFATGLLLGLATLIAARIAARPSATTRESV